jgi:hypothetical protein
VHAQPPPGDELVSLPDATELNTDNCFSTVLLEHCGQRIFSRLESTMVSKRWLQRWQLYSKIGI